MSNRPIGYKYWTQLREHLGNTKGCVFDGELVYPRQLEIHLPGNHLIPCNFNCSHCQGRKLKQPLGDWEQIGLSLLRQLEDSIPYHIYGGAYTEPLLNGWLPHYIALTKQFGCSFGVHTNGSMLTERTDFLDVVEQTASSKKDYVSISLDAGDQKSHSFVKRKGGYFNIIVRGIRKLKELDNPNLSIRIVYLMNNLNSEPDVIKKAVDIARDIGVDSLRFSIPYDNYGVDFDHVRGYKQHMELRYKDEYYSVVEPYLSKGNEKPFIFWIPPECQDVDKLTYRQCIYSYYQITLGADGYVYRCSSTASPSFKACRLGKIPDSLDAFNAMIIANHNPNWKPQTCFSMGARCNRIAMEINEEWDSQKH